MVFGGRQLLFFSLPSLPEQSPLEWLQSGNTEVLIEHMHKKEAVNWLSSVSVSEERD